MKTRLFPAFATLAILALAAVAPAQDRGRRSGGESRERSSPSRSGGGERSRGESRSRDASPSRDSSNRDSGRSRDDARTNRSDSRSSDSRPGGSRPSDPRPSDRSSGDSRPSRGNDVPRRDESRPSDGRPGGAPDRSPDRRDRDSRPSDSRNDGSRRNPFDRSERPRDARPGDRSNDRSGWPDRSNDRPSRPGTPESASGRRSPFDRNGGFGGRDDRRPSGGFGNRDDRGANRGGFGGWNDRRPNRPVYAAPTRFDGRGRFDRPVRYATPPIHSVLGVQIRRSDARRGSDFAFGGVFGGLRVGYVSYGGYGGYGGRSGFGFGYTHYAYDPFAPDCAVVASPWYRYSYLPPYIDNSRVIVVNNYPSSWNWDGWQTYDVRSERRDEAVQGALDDLRDAFEEASDRYGNRLIPQDGNVAIYNDGRYDYSLNPDDFAQMFLDGIEQSKTVRYEIQEVRRQGDEVRVRARHTYEDSWGQEQSVIHTLTLRRGRDGGYVIREFGSE